MKGRKSITIMSIILAVLVVILAVLLLKDKGKNQEDEEQTQSTETQEISLDGNLTITAIDSYSGAFVEDGSNEDVEDILMITVQNNGEQTLQYAETKILFGDVTAEFAFSTLRPGASMVVLEKNRLVFPGNKEMTTSQIQNVVYFNEEPDFCEDKLEVSVLDGAFNVKNISGEDLTGNIAIYYKNRQQTQYLGGITYRAVIEGGIEKDGIRQIMTKHFKVDESEVMFVGYTEME